MPPSNEPHIDLETEFHNIKISSHRQWSFVYALRRCFSVVTPSLQDALIPHIDQMLRSALGAEFFQKIGSYPDQKTLTKMAEQDQNFARSMIDAATIVVIHAALDSALNQYLTLLAQAEPSLWESEVSADRVTLSGLKGSSYVEILRKRAIAHARSLSAKSLSKKMQIILDRCTLKGVVLSPAGFQFDPERIRRFDETRHNVAHGRGLGIIVSNMDEAILFLWQTFLSLEAVIGARLEFKPGVDQVLKSGIPQVLTVTL